MLRGEACEVAHFAAFGALTSALIATPRRRLRWCVALE
jgi:hypothetical protein